MSVMHAPDISPRESPSTVLTTQEGVITQWGKEMGHVTGIPERHAVGRTLWEVMAAVAPAEIPFEVAREEHLSDFRALTRQSLFRRNWCETFIREVLTDRGEVRRLTVRISPTWEGSRYHIVCRVVQVEYLTEMGYIVESAFPTDLHTEVDDKHVATTHGPPRKAGSPSP